MPHTASCRCGRKWTGTVAAHCTVCHEHFSTVKNFDLHQPDRKGCAHPSTRTRRKQDGTVIPLFKATESVYGITWVGFTEDARYAEDEA